jgi:hypothetical protein
MDNRSKLDPLTRRALAKQGGAESVAGKLSLFVQGHRPFGEAELGLLRAGGAEIQSVSGDVLTAEVPADKVAGIAEHPFVMRVEGSAPLGPEGGGPPFADVE